MLEQNQIATCLDYTLGVLLGETKDTLAAKKVIAYSKPDSLTNDTVRLHLVPSDFFGTHYGKPESLPHLPLKEIEGVPLLYGIPQIERRGRVLVVRADIIASAFFLLTRYEEMVRRNVRDEHGRFPGRKSLPFRAGFIDRPVVDEYAALMRKWLRQVGVDIPEPQRRFSVLLSHDVDSVKKYRSLLRTTAAVLLGRRPWREIQNNFRVLSGSMKEPFNTFDEMIQLDNQCKAAIGEIQMKTAYFFLAGNICPQDKGYCINNEFIKTIIQKVKDSGAIIGLHASYYAGMHPENIIKERTSLEQITGCTIHHNRYHYLAWREIEDGQVLAKAGIDWDSTLGYADVAGFRLGVCRPIPLFDPIHCKLLGIEEHPLILMDHTLSEDKYMGFNIDEAWEYFQRLLTQVRRYDGELTVLWHNSVFEATPDNYHPEFYRKMMKELVM